MPPRETASDERPAARGIWSGSISFGLVTVPVELYSATRRDRPSLRMLSPDGAPLAREYVCPEDGSILSRDDIERGYEIDEGKFVVVSDEELEALAPRRSRDIELTRFVDRDALDPAFFERSYFLIPGGEQSKAYRLLAETMERTNRAAIAHFVMRGKAYAVAILADNGVLRAETLRFGDEVRDASEIQLPKQVKVDKKRVQHMQQLVKRLSRDSIDEKELVDDEAEKLLALARDKQKRGKDVVEAPDAPPDDEEGGGAEVVDIMALLKKRLREGGRKTGSAPRTRSKATGAKRKTKRAAAKKRSTRR